MLLGGYGIKRRILSFIITLALCLNLCPVRAFAADEGTYDGLCPHHPAHTDACGYVPGSPGAPCTFACQICPVGDLIGKLPGSVSGNNSGQVQAQLSEIYALYDGLTADEQQQVDLSPCISLQDQLDGMGLATLSDTPGGSDSPKQFLLSGDYSQSKLPNIIITIRDPNEEDLHPYLQYSYRKDGDTEFTEGLPTNAGTYKIKAYIPESQNYKAAETNPLLTLTINKIPALTTAPIAKTLTYNREAQELVTAGILEPGAAAEGAAIEFARAEDGPYSTDIPTGITVTSYDVWYRVADTENYTGQSGKLSARIDHKKITAPTVELSYYTTV